MPLRVGSCQATLNKWRLNLEESAPATVLAELPRAQSTAARDGHPEQP